MRFLEIRTPIITIPSPALNYLSAAPERENKQQCEIDINRTQIFINSFNLQEEFSPHNSDYAKSQDKFDFARRRISEVIEEQYPTVGEEQREYFSYLVLNLTHQDFLQSVFNGLKCTELMNVNIAAALQSNGITIVGDHSLTVHSDRVDLLYERTIAYGTEANPRYFEATFAWHFYPDKTMAFEIVGPNEHKEYLNKIFAEITSGSIARAICNAQNTSQDEPHLFLLTDFIRCYLNDIGCDLAELDQEDIAKIYAIERLSSGRPYTIARMIDSYMKNNNIEIGNDIYDRLPEETKENLCKIGKELEKRLDNRGVLMTIGDAIDIIINFFLKVAKYFEMKIGESYISNSQFNEFCGKLQVNLEAPLGHNSNVFLYDDDSNQAHELDFGNQQEYLNNKIRTFAQQLQQLNPINFRNNYLQ